jgi:hypothetical protein
MLVLDVSGVGGAGGGNLLWDHGCCAGARGGRSALVRKQVGV